MAEKTKDYGVLFSVLVILSFVLVVAVVCFQWFEIDKYRIQNHIKDSIMELFSSDAGAVSAPADTEVSEDSAE